MYILNLKSYATQKYQRFKVHLTFSTDIAATSASHAGDGADVIHTTHNTVNVVVSLGNKGCVFSSAFAKIPLLFVVLQLSGLTLLPSSSVMLVPAGKGRLSPLGFSFATVTMLTSQ